MLLMCERRPESCRLVLSIHCLLIDLRPDGGCHRLIGSKKLLTWALVHCVQGQIKDIQLLHQLPPTIY